MDVEDYTAPRIPGIPPPRGEFQRFCAKRYFLTYSKVRPAGSYVFNNSIPVGVQEMIDGLSQKPVHWAGVKEQHADGGLHYHLIVIFENMFRSRNLKAFDIVGSLDSRMVLHPHIRVLNNDRDLARAWEYIHKGLSPSFGPWEGPLLPANPNQKEYQSQLPQRQRAWAWIISAENASEFWYRIKKVQPEAFATRLNQLCEFVQAIYAPPRPIYHPTHKIFPNITRGMRGWLATEFKKRDRPKTLVLWGPSRTGKTAWARSLGPHSYMGALFNLNEFSEASEYIIFDDVDPKQIYTTYKSWFGGQQSFSVTDKYRRKIVVQWGKPMIWLSNDNPLEIEGWDARYIRANSKIVHVERRLY